jgi:dTDP-4-dehydrorhamnose 3,5-epimerase
MKIIETDLKGLFIIEPNVYNDKRGYFFESYKKNIFDSIIGKIDFVQENESKSNKGVLRGLHFQKPPFDQSKLVRCNEGKVLDVVVDIRKNSITYGKYKSFILSSENKIQLFVPKGFAHGFVVLSDIAIFSYKVDNVYSPKSDSGIIWNDNQLNIDWKLNNANLIISEKDNSLLSLSDLKTPFL